MPNSGASADTLHELRPGEPEPSGVELWGGVECTCNRVGDRYFDQMELSGHAHRLSDLDEFRRLGLRTLRVGLLWERWAQHGSRPGSPESSAHCWGWSDACLGRLQQLGIRPIAGLVHHGSGPGGPSGNGLPTNGHGCSGPSDTSLLDPEFPEKLADYAARVAERYPWIDAYTPVNEPNTTARFSAMYGLWYPHHRSRASYLRALLAQVRGTVLSMRAIRRVRADARLIQTEDVGRISGTAELRPVWELLNTRQWLTFDLLCGTVDRQHPLFAWMRAEGVAEAEILWFADHPCPPDVVGLNYYLTSDRYLDHRTELYAENRGSAEGRFVDVEAVRVHPQGIAGVESLLQEAWTRYRLPVAITEVHLGCSVEEQIRWLAESWEAVVRARGAGVDCVAMTAWALLGSFYWNRLVTCENGYYEPGVFDVSGGRPVQTELAEVVAQIAHGLRPSHPALAQPGWWHHPDRICLPAREGMAAVVPSRQPRVCHQLPGGSVGGQNRPRRGGARRL